MMVKIELELTPDEHAKLAALAAAKTARRRKRKPHADSITINDCLRAFARTCQPGGDGWKHPTDK